ncbi:hypothetical protein DFA_09796 [Cavenderia fasciculata]|uniref:EamA domain-containing protein n=1 Tax=Cavenderia fasciculata TaxID=261658 RepID=F4Q8M4_CACFS|nr:uncharacterized protein DFA_09796 [Cavenderia fasciculata]EGG16124.1 hypothetical protein DFA_09796 [Cavenderia fasciculata]|eukprot:XP_004352462.1 hypothetical protein DFA_09796 [Cavenderia fasciculata]
MSLVTTTTTNSKYVQLLDSNELKLSVDEKPTTTTLATPAARKSSVSSVSSVSSQSLIPPPISSPLKSTQPILFKPTTTTTGNIINNNNSLNPVFKINTIVTAGPTFLSDNEQIHDQLLSNNNQTGDSDFEDQDVLNVSTTIDIPLHSSASSINTSSFPLSSPQNILIGAPITSTTSTSSNNLIQPSSSSTHQTTNNKGSVLKQSSVSITSNSSILKASGGLRKSRADLPHRHHHPLNLSIISDDHLVLATSSDYFPPPSSSSSSVLRSGAPLAAIPLVSLKKKSERKKKSALEEVKYGEEDGAGPTTVDDEDDAEDQEFVGYDQDDIEQQQQALDILMETDEVILMDLPLHRRLWEKIKPHMGIVYMVFSAFLFSLLALLVKLTSSSVSSLEIAFIRSFYGLIGCLIILGSMKVNPLGDPSKRVFLTVRGFTGTMSLTAYFYTLSVLPLSEAVCISFTSPVITAALAAIVLKERWGIVEAICAILSLVGVFIISKPPFLFGTPTYNESLPGHLRLIYILIGLGGACFSSFSFVAVRKIGPGTNPFVLVLYFSITSCVVLLPLTLLTKKFTIPQGTTWIWLSVLSIIALGAQGLVNRGIQLLKAGKAASINYIQIVFTFFWEVLVLKESVDVWTLLGAALILCCAAITAFRK